ncbi:DJ-1/PfpI family protein, partial [Nocardia wallacei]|uniref:DJ-1/PfpI family protein n=1 Tax=Nocardia wallacei TaxID=480035 RepID=UPI0024547069
MTRPHRVAVLALAPVVGFDMTIPPTVLGNAAAADGTRLYDVRICGLSTEPVTATMGYAIVPQSGPDWLGVADTVIVPGTQMSGPRREGTITPELAEALSTIRADARIVSICTGAFVLGAAGVLDGRRAPTHRAVADDIRRHYPRVRLDENLLFVEG